MDEASSPLSAIICTHGVFSHVLSLGYGIKQGTAWFKSEQAVWYARGQISRRGLLLASCTFKFRRSFILNWPLVTVKVKSDLTCSTILQLLYFFSRRHFLLPWIFPAQTRVQIQEMIAGDLNGSHDHRYHNLTYVWAPMSWFLLTAILEPNLRQVGKETWHSWGKTNTQLDTCM